MNHAFPDFLYNGIIVCICIQLVIIGVIKILSKDTRAILIGIFCFILGTTFIYDIYWNYFKTSFFFSILLHNYKIIYYGPLLYLFVALLQENYSKKKVINHLIIPSIVFLSYVIIKHVFESFFYTNIKYVIYSIHALYFILICYYFILGHFLFKNLKPILKPKAMKRYYLFYNSLLGYLWIFSLYTICI